MIKRILALAACLALPASAWAFPGAHLQTHQTGSSLVLRIAVICEQRREGNTLWTNSCPDDYLCRRKTGKEKAESKTDAKFRCEPGPEVLRQQQKKAEAEWARNHKLEVERGNAETERQLQQLERRSREQANSDKIVPTLPNRQSRIRPGLPGTQYRQANQGNPSQGNPAQGSGAPSPSGGGSGGTGTGAAIGAVVGAAGNMLDAVSSSNSVAVPTPTVRTEPPKVTTPAPSPARTETPTVATPSPVTTPTPRLSWPTTSASCSDITGTDSAGPARQCATARKALETARDDRTKYPQRAAKRYQEATTAYRQAGDHSRATLALREATAKDPAPFIAAEAELAQRTKNIEEAENNARVARKIEEGAFESGSCADLQRAADYYLDAANYFLRADQLEAVNVLLLRKDHLERLVDEAKQKGLCNRRLSTRRTASLTSPSPESHLPDEQCRAILDHIKRAPDLQKGGTGAALMVELASKGCKEPNGPALTASQCQLASVTWSLRDVSTEEIDRRLKAAHCPCEVRGGEIRCDRARP